MEMLPEYMFCLAILIIIVVAIFMYRLPPERRKPKIKRKVYYSPAYRYRVPKPPTPTRIKNNLKSRNSLPKNGC